jgi:hypothetical protein
MIPTLYKRAIRGSDKILATFENDVSVSSGSVYNNDGHPVYQIKFGPWSDDKNRYVFQLEQPELESLIITLATEAGYAPFRDDDKHPARFYPTERLPIGANWLRALADRVDQKYVENKAAEAAKAKRQSEGFRT